MHSVPLNHTASQCYDLIAFFFSEKQKKMEKKEATFLFLISPSL